MKHKLIITLLLPFLFAASCSKDDTLEPDQLPPITQEGLNTFGCIINGEVMMPKDSPGSLFGFPAKGLVVKYRNDTQHFFNIISRNRDKNYTYIYMYIPALISTGTYNFGLSNGRESPLDSPPHPHAYIIKRNKDDIRTFYYSYSNSGQIHITRFDTINTIVSGTFELRAFDVDNPSDTIQITQGRFDVNWVKL